MQSAENDPRPSPQFAIVIPILNEAQSIEGVLADCLVAVADMGPCEFVLADDGSTDGTAALLTAFQAAHPGQVTIVTHPRPAGKSAAIQAAARAATAPIIVTLDGDGQNPPSELPNMLDPFLRDGADPNLGLVAGQRIRRDDPLPRLLASRIANRLRGWLLKDSTRDTACGYKAFRRAPYLELPFFENNHRFLPALFQRDGWSIGHVDVTHKAREAGQSKYTNFGRAVVGLSDMFGVAWLIRRRRRVGRNAASISRREG